MKISYNWLKEYLKTELSPEKIAEVLTDIGLEVDSFEKIESVRGGLEGIVVGEVLTCGKHPDADKLSVTTVNIGNWGDGSGAEPVQIVCGAPNVAAGQKVLVATINCTLYPTGEQEGFKIKKSKIRGVESMGMICAEDELGLGISHEGIMVLSADAVAGTPAKQQLKIEDDYLIEIGLTPNRVDAASHYGVARDLAVYLKSHSRPYELKLPSVDSFKQNNNSREITVEVKNNEAAPRYMGVTMTGLKVGSSPEWLQKRLRAIGMNPKNNIVDITNFILHETGQPLHAFDADKIDGGKIVVRTCDEGTKFVTLDEVERNLSSDDLMICSATTPMCIAGVFGGIDSGVTENTTSVFIESAYFNPVWVRRTAKRHGLNTDSSFRFERGIDPDMTPYALKRAAVLIKEIAGGEITSPVTDIYPAKIEAFRFDVSYERINKLIGKEIPEQTIRTIIDALDVKIEKESDGILSVAVPPFRVDVQREIDLIEDILRIYGYNNVEIPQRVNSTLAYVTNPDKDKMRNVVSDMLTSNGFNEIMSNSLTKASYYERLTSYNLDKCVKILNPLSNDLSVMRQTLLFNMMEAVELNINHRNPDMKLYEFGNCYYYDAAKSAQSKAEGSEVNPLSAYREQNMLAVAVTGADHVQSWNEKSEPATFYTLKKFVEKILLRFGMNINDMVMEPLVSELYDEAVSCKINGRQVFEMGIVSRKIRSVFDVKQAVYFMEMNLDLFIKAVRNNKVTVKDLSKYPEVKRDLALLVDSAVTFSQLRKIAFLTEKKLLKNVGLFDVYEGDKLPEGRKSYALSFILEDTTQTMTDKVIDKIMNNLIREFENQANARIRS